jgi:signal transduction histidine kinase
VPVLGRQLRVPLRRATPAQRAIAFGIAAGGIGAITAVSLPFRADLGLGGFLLLTLLVVIVAAIAGGGWPALAAVGLSFFAGAFFFAPPYESLSIAIRLHNVPLIAYLIVGAALGLLVQVLADVVEQETDLRQVEAALRRVATVAARGAPAGELFDATTREAGGLLGASGARLARLEPDGTTTVVARWDRGAGGGMIAPGPNSISAPVVVDGHRWGSMSADLDAPATPASARIEARLERFTELLATAISSAQSRDELAASRRRIVTAADDARRRIERELHDGAQQRLVALTLRLRTAQRTASPQDPALEEALASVGDALTGVIDELREMARGIHPAILAQGGLGPALRTLARRSPTPVQIDVDVEGRLADQVEVAAYYVVSEALANVAKHAQASLVTIDASASADSLQISIVDDRLGGADPALGSGLTGLRDRVQALGGEIAVSSPPGQGTRLGIELPLRPPDTGWLVAPD